MHTVYRPKIVASLLGALAFTASVSARDYPGFLTFEAWYDLPGAAQTDITDNLGSLSAAPSFTGYMSNFNTRTVFGDDSHETYLARISGWFIPSANGDYRFHVRSDDASQVFISSDATLPDPGTATPNAMESGCCGGFETTGETVSEPVTMTAGQRYGIVVLLKEGGGGDWLELAARAEGDTAALGIIPGTFLATTADDLSIVTQPSNFSGPENFPATTSVEANNVPGVTYVWESAPAGSSTFTAVDGQTKATLTVTPTLNDNNRQYRVVVSAPGGQSRTSSIVTLSVAGDSTAPSITSASTFIDRTGVVLMFSEAMAAGFDQASKYTISGATVSGVEAIGQNGVFIRTAAALPANATVTVTGTGLTDKATTPNALSPNSASVTVSGGIPAGSQVQTGKVLYERWDAHGSLDLLVEELDSGTQAPASVMQFLPSFDAPTGVADNYSARLSSYFIPPTTGDYVFFSSSDDQGRLYLSTDSDRANKKAITFEPQWNDPRDWVALDRRNAAAPENRSNTYDGTEWPTGNTITLVGGQKYWLEFLFHEGGGGDNGAATFTMASAAAPADGTASALTGAAVAQILNPSQLPPEITQRPQGKVFARGETVTISVGATGPGTLSYQWYRNKVAIDNSNMATLTFPNAGPSIIGDYYVEVSNANGMTSTYPDNDQRLIMTGAFVIEAEDFNYEGGKHLPTSDKMPLLGGEYRGLRSTLDVDFFHNKDTADAAAHAYLRFTPDDLNAVPLKGHEAGDIKRGSFNVSPNYATGWTQATEWQNYTRTIPQGDYAIFAGVSHDGRDPDQINMIVSKVANPTIADGSDVGVEGGAQGLTKIGGFLSPATGGWSNNDLVPLKDDAGNIVSTTLGGLTTLRVTFNETDGDLDYLLLYCTTCPSVPVVTPFVIEAEDFNTGGGQSVAAASTMPLAANLFNGLGAVAGVDYNDPGNEQDGGAQAYRTGESPNVAIAGTGDNDRITFTLNPNYKIGWMAGGDWWNYTRTFPAGKYKVYAALSQDLPNSLGELALIADGTVTDQTVTTLGTFTHEGNSGGWSINQYIPLTDDAGNDVIVDLSGTKTVRYTGTNGDFDFLSFVKVGDLVVEENPVITSITRSGNNVVIVWTGGGTLEGSPVVKGGTWTPVTGNGTATVPIGSGNMFFRVNKP